MSGNEEVGQQLEARSDCPIVRTHRRFLLRQLEFTQQYAPMYRSRMAAQQDRAIAAIKRVVAAEDGETAMPVEVLRVLEMQPGVPAFTVGVVYKQMKLLPRFLDEYQRELVRIDAGDDNEGGDGAEDAAAELDGEAEGPGATEADAPKDESALGTGQERAAADEHYSVCHNLDELMLEDSSGRITLQGLRATHFCTGVVIGIYGTLLPSGQVLVHRYAFADVKELYVPRPMASAPGKTHEPCYIAFVCGLDVTLPENTAFENTGSGSLGPNGMAPKSPTHGSSAGTHAALVRHRAMLEMLIDFISGTTSDASLLEKSRRISRLVIGGNSIALTDEQKLKKKVKLDPSDHVRLNDDRGLAGVVTSAKLMRELDAVLERLAAAVEVELMPGDNDMSDAFQPQQPLHPVLLPNAGRYSSLRLVSNPFEFTALVNGSTGMKKEDEEHTDAKRKGPKLPPSQQEDPSKLAHGVSVFVTSGQNVNDVALETRFETRLGAMAMILGSGCACPTAPNTLFSYPFREVDPFLFHRTPHCFVACDQPHFETRYVGLDTLVEECSSFLAKGDGANEERDEGKPGSHDCPPRGTDTPAVRLVCVPAFARAGSLVLVDVNSPTLETTRVTFAMRGLDEK